MAPSLNFSRLLHHLINYHSGVGECFLAPLILSKLIHIYQAFVLISDASPLHPPFTTFSYSKKIQKQIALDFYYLESVESVISNQRSEHVNKKESLEGLSYFSSPSNYPGPSTPDSIYMSLKPPIYPKAFYIWTNEETGALHATSCSNSINKVPSRSNSFFHYQANPPSVPRILLKLKLLTFSMQFRFHIRSLFLFAGFESFRFFTGSTRKAPKPLAVSVFFMVFSFSIEALMGSSCIHEASSE